MMVAENPLVSEQNFEDNIKYIEEAEHDSSHTKMDRMMQPIISKNLSQTLLTSMNITKKASDFDEHQRTMGQNRSQAILTKLPTAFKA